VVAFLCSFVLIQRNQKSRKNDPISPHANPRPAFFHANALYKCFAFIWTIGMDLKGVGQAEASPSLISWRLLKKPLKCGGMAKLEGQ
jgi:hypothetical protein